MHSDNHTSIYDVDIVHVHASSEAISRGGTVQRLGHTLLFTPSGIGWPFMVHIHHDDATVELPFGARLGVGADSIAGQPLLDVIRAILDGRAEVWITAEDGRLPSAHAIRVSWGANGIAAGAVGTGVRIVAPGWTAAQN
ncbi:hypothetical protein ACTQ49_11915 [Luteococcus sp. Sow4_B9]|uniref:hypothetical protein n=1 Tax=Luteococcus sp. Sow4_B9 TaxID=3438792 RepID=UPI003F9922CA